MPKLLHVIGRKNHGKTMLLLELIRAFRERGVKVGSIKHTSHRHELDREGKDSQRHRTAGAKPAAVISDNLAGVFFEPLPGEDLYQRIMPFYADCDLVLVEGDHLRAGPKLEVWRKELGTAPMAAEIEGVIALVSDDTPPIDGLACWRRSDLSDLCRKISEHLHLGGEQ